MEITSINNKKVKEWMKLKEKKYRDLDNKFLIEGDHLLEEALKRAKVLEIITDDEKFLREGIEGYLVTKEILNKLSSQVSGTNVIGVVEKIDSQELKGNVCLLEDIQDPGNLGAIIRSAVAFNIETIVLSDKTVDLYNEKVIRASEGMLFHLNFRRGNLKEIGEYLKKEGYKIYGTNVKEGTNLKDISFSLKNGIIIGNEGRGMSKELEECCDCLVNIPINSNCESLNASVAASIIFYEMQK